MTRHSTAGHNDYDASTVNKPQTSEAVRVGVLSLADNGFGDHGIAEAFGLAVEQVRRILADRYRR